MSFNGSMEILSSFSVPIRFGQLGEPLVEGDEASLFFDLHYRAAEPFREVANWARSSGRTHNCGCDVATDAPRIAIVLGCVCEQLMKEARPTTANDACRSCTAFM
jgi:hypothetical protein